MLIENDILLYHGSYTKVIDIDLNESFVGKDFGKGFYLTQNKLQARQFIKTSVLKAQNKGIISGKQKFGYVNIYKLMSKTIDKLSVYEFEDANAEWLWFIAKNRKENLKKDIKKLIDNNIDNADIIVGKIANDTTNPVITAFLNGLYGKITDESTIKIVTSMLLPDKLDYQYCFKTKRAIKCLEFVEAKKYEV